MIFNASLQVSDNTRHKAINPSTGKPFLLPAHAIKRVVLCMGQIYYHLSQARRGRRIRDLVLVRLEQIAPFPSDLLIKASMLSYTALTWHSLSISTEAIELCASLACFARLLRSSYSMKDNIKIQLWGSASPHIHLCNGRRI